MTSFELHVPSAATSGVVTIGNFDGVHRGHQAMLSVVRERAALRSCPAVVVTFDPHPVAVLRPELQLPRLTSIETRTQLLKEHGVSEVVVLPVSRQLLSMTPQKFFHDVVVTKLQPQGLVEGPDFRFGKDRTGDVHVLAGFCRNAGIEFHAIDAICSSDEMISSTRIRQLLAQGKVSAATELLGHDYSISGLVQRGAGRGRALGFPTANLESIEELLPENGVYAAECRIDQIRYPVALSIGPNPTFGDELRKVEAHISGYSGDLYGRPLKVGLTARLRGLVSFESAESLVEQIRADVATSVRTFDARHGTGESVPKAF